MDIQQVASGITIHVDSSEIVNYFLKLALKKVKNKKPYKYGTAYASSFRIDVRFIETPPKEYLNKRKTMLEKANKIKLSVFIEEFRSTGNKETQRLISQFCNVFKDFDEKSLEFLVSKCKEDVLKFRRGGPKALDLFEQFIKSKGFSFATFWTGKEWL